MPAKLPRPRLRTNTIGSEAAELDSNLSSCFVPTSGYQAIRSLDDQRCIVLGRAGTGKTAILRHLQQSHPHVIAINPQSLAFQLLTSSNLLQSLRSSGINLDPFYQSLWRHVLVIEILKHYLADNAGKSRLLQGVQELLRRNARRAQQLEAARRYLDGLSQNFFNDITERVTEIHTTLENNLRIALNAGSGVVWSEFLPVSGAVTLDRSHNEVMVERQNRAQQVVSTTRANMLDEVTALLDEVVIDDQMKRGFVLIDDLDTDWVDNSISYDLTRALLQEVFHFASLVSSIKVVIALRENILSHVETDPELPRGYQREKLEAQRLHLHWNEDEIRNLVEMRINHLLNVGYDGPYLTISSVFPARSRHGVGGFEYVLRLSHGRPRDIVKFINLCLEATDGRLPIPMKVIENVEPGFSHWKFNGLIDEWRPNYAGLGKVATLLLRGKPSTFHIGDWSDDDIVEAVAAAGADRWGKELEELLMGGALAGAATRSRLARVLYETGIVGLRLSQDGEVRHAHNDYLLVVEADVTASTRVLVHPSIRRHLQTTS